MSKCTLYSGSYNRYYQRILMIQLNKTTSFYTFIPFPCHRFNSRGSMHFTSLHMYIFVSTFKYDKPAVILIKISITVGLPYMHLVAWHFKQSPSGWVLSVYWDCLICTVVNQILIELIVWMLFIYTLVISQIKIHCIKSDTVLIVWDVV